MTRTNELDMQYYLHVLSVTVKHRLKLFFVYKCTMSRTHITTDFQPGGAEDLDKPVSVETPTCLTQWKLNFVILFVFQVFPEHGDSPAAPASCPVHVS